MNAQSREQQIDSLQEKLLIANDTSHVLLLLELSKRKVIKNAEEAIDLIQQAIHRSHTIRFNNGLAAAYSLLVEMNVVLFYDYDRAKLYLDSAFLVEPHIPPYYKRLVYNAAGLYFTQAGKMEESYYWLLQCLRINENYEDEIAAQLYEQLGYHANVMGRYAEAKRYFKKYIRIGERTGRKSFVGAGLTNLATVYSQLNQYDSALRVLKKLYAFEFTHGNPGDNVLLLSNLGTTYLELNFPDSAYHYLHRGLHAAQRVNQKEGFDGIYLALAGYHQFHHPDSSVYYARKVIFSQGNGNLYAKEKATQLLANAFAKKGRFDSAFHYLQLNRQLYTEVLNENATRQIAELQLQYGLEKKEAEITDLKQLHELNVARQRLFVVGIVSLALLLSGLYFYFRLLLRNKRKELLTANNRLNDYLGRLLEKSELIEELNMQLEKARQGEAVNNPLENLDKVVNSTILTEEDWREFKGLFEKVHKGFFGELKSKFPDLTNAEIRLAALLKLKLSTREIASMLGISPESVSKTRHRLRKKLNLPAEEKLEEFITSVQP